MFKKFFKNKKYKYFSQSEMNQVNHLQQLCIDEKNSEVLKEDWQKLAPKCSTYESIKLMLHFLAAASLKKKTLSTDIYRSLVFGDGLCLYDKEDQNYLIQYSYNILRINFGENLNSMPDDIKEYIPVAPNISQVTDDVKQRFIMSTAEGYTK